MGVASAHTSFGSELNENCNCLQGMGHTQHCKGGRCGWREGKFPFTVVNCVVVLCAMSVCEQASTQKILIHGPLVCQQGGEMQKSINLPATASIVQLSSSVRHPLPCHWLLCYWYYKVIVLESRCHHTLCQGLLLSSASELPWLHFFLQQFPMSWSMLNLFLSRLTESQNSPGWNKPQKTIKSNLLWVKGAQMRLTSTLFNCILKTSTISLGRVSQWWGVLTIKMSFLYQNETQFAPVAPSLLHVAPYEERASVPYSHHFSTAILWWGFPQSLLFCRVKRPTPSVFPQRAASPVLWSPLWPSPVFLHHFWTVGAQTGCSALDVI